MSYVAKSVPREAGDADHPVSSPIEPRPVDELRAELRAKLARLAAADRALEAARVRDRIRKCLAEERSA